MTCTLLRSKIESVAAEASVNGKDIDMSLIRLVDCHSEDTAKKYYQMNRAKNAAKAFQRQFDIVRSIENNSLPVASENDCDESEDDNVPLLELKCLKRKSERAQSRKKRAKSGKERSKRIVLSDTEDE